MPLQLVTVTDLVPTVVNLATVMQAGQTTIVEHVITRNLPTYLPNLADCSSLNNCNVHGTCIGPSTCNCTTGWGGSDCSEGIKIFLSLKIYPLAQCTTGCSGHGTCFAPPSTCNCTAGWLGSDCSTRM